MSWSRAFARNFLGNAPAWYKQLIVAFLIINPLLYATAGGVVAGWALIAEFIFTLALSLKCYPLPSGGLLALEAAVIGLTGPQSVLGEILQNFEVILLLIFMVAGIHFMRELLLYGFSRLLVQIRSKMLLSLLFCATAALLSAFLDALTVIAVLISVCTGFYGIYHRVASGRTPGDDHDPADDGRLGESQRADLEQFRAFLRSLVMHGAVGTALGGTATLVGEPQNLLIAQQLGWQFMEFFWRMAPVSVPVLCAGLMTCLALELSGWFGYGALLPPNVARAMRDFVDTEEAGRDASGTARLLVQLFVAILLVIALGLHLASVGLIGLMVIVLLTAFAGIVDEHRIGHAFTEALPFTALLVVFFCVVGVIHDQHLFAPVIDRVLAMDPGSQPAVFFLANGLLSAISDNVFVATVYISELKRLFDAGAIGREHFEALAIAINTGTNLPSVATPNGQAAFLFLLTSALAPLIRLSYGTMVWMALPYTVVLTGIGLLCVVAFVGA